jgi:hypothetical protein
MAILGLEGIVRLIREAPEPMVLLPNSISISSNGLLANDPAYWSGDKVKLSGEFGLPLIDANGEALSPTGYGMWSGGPWLRSPLRQHVVNENSLFYTGVDTSQFWSGIPGATGPGNAIQTEREVWIYRDQLDRISFYDSRSDGLNGDPGRRFRIANVDFGELTVTGIESDWEIVCNLQDWSLELNAPEVDTTSLSTRFGEAIKSLVTGGGTFNYLVDRTNIEDVASPTTLMKLLLITEKGSKAHAQFWMIQDRPKNPCNKLLPGDMYYECDILVSNTVVSVRATEAIVGSARFVTTGSIELKEGTN